MRKKKTGIPKNYSYSSSYFKTSSFFITDKSRIFLRVEVNRLNSNGIILILINEMVVKIPLSFFTTCMRKYFCEKSANWENGANNLNFSDMCCIAWLLQDLSVFWFFFCCYFCSSGSGWDRGGHDPPPGPVKICNKKDGCLRRLHRFHVSYPPPPGLWICYCYLTYKTFNQFTICLHKEQYFSLNDTFVFLIKIYPFL